MKRSWWKLALGILIVFAMGFGSGILGTIIVAKKIKKRAEDPVVGHGMVVRHLTKRLKLDESQQKQVSAVMKEMVGEIVPIRTETRRKLAITARQHMPRIREALRPDQQERFDEFLQELEKDWHVALRVKP